MSEFQWLRLTSKDPGSIPGWILIFITCTMYYYYPPFHTSSSPAQQRGRRPECRPGAWKPDGGSHSSEQQKESWNTCCGGSASDHWEAQSPLSVTAAKKEQHSFVNRLSENCSTLATVSSSRTDSSLCTLPWWKLVAYISHYTDILSPGESPLGTLGWGQWWARDGSQGVAW